MKHIKIPYVLLGMMLWCNLSYSAKTFKRCSSVEVLQRQLLADPSMKKRMDAIEQFTADFVSTATQRKSGIVSSKFGAVISIPVVVHVLYNNPLQNISDAMIQAQLEVLNKDYSYTNTDKNMVPSVYSPLGANTNIQFCLAKRDPTGAATTGIIRTQTTVTAFVDDDKVKSSATGGDNAWDASHYLNLWICNMANGILGYAQFPGGAPETDGVVLLYSSLPGGSATPYNLGRTATHEVGHWLNLHHTWGDSDCGTDYVDDTPQQQYANFGCPTYPHPSCTNNGDMSMNYMDYTDDACMYLFTTGQAARINALFTTGGERESIVTSNGCIPPGEETCETPSVLKSTSLTSSSAVLIWSPVNGVTSYNIEYKTSASSSWMNTTSTTNTKTLTGLLPGTVYNYKVQALCNSPGAFSTTSSFTTEAMQFCSIPTDIRLISLGESVATITWSAVPGATRYDVQYKAASDVVWSTSTVNGITKNFTALIPGMLYDYKVRATCSSPGEYSPVSSFTTADETFTTTDPATVCTDNYENNNTFAEASSITANTEIKAQISSASDIDWFKFSNTDAAPNIKVTLSNLAKDYDLELYNSSGIFLLMSDNTGTSSEGIVYNAAPVGTYYIKVMGYSGANSSSCYTLKPLLSNAVMRDIDAVDSKSIVKSDKTVNIYPNPSRGDFNITYSSDADRKTTIIIYDLSGKILKSETFASVKGENLKNISLPDVMNGLYLMDFNNGIEKKIYKIIINK